MDRINYRPTWAEIDLGCLDHNFRVVRRMVGPKTKILVPVKADAYGHGIIAVARRLSQLGVDYLGVAGIDEGIALRKAGITKPVLILSTILVEDAAAILEYQLTQTICTRELALRLNTQARSRKVQAVVHIKIDTGMNRIGVACRDAYEFIKAVSRLNNIKIEGLFTHMPCAGTNPCFTKVQIEMFDRLIRSLDAAGVNVPLRHVSNSLGVINYPHGHFNMVRPGLMIYGLNPAGKAGIGLKALLSLKTRVIYLKDVPRGTGISYGHTFLTPGRMRIATLPIGYGDGYFRCLSNKAYCLISGKKAVIVGRVCMDHMMVNVTGIKNVKIGQEAVLIGRQRGATVTVEDLSRLAGTIPYEIVCNFGGRVRRVYKNTR